MSDTDAFGYGYEDPTSSASDLDVIVFACKRLIAQLDTMKLVQVVAVHPGQGTPPTPGTVDVLPLVNQIDGNGYPVKHTTVYGLPFFRIQAGSWAIVVDPVVNDVGYVICADRDSSSVVNNNGMQANPGSRRKYNIADGVYVGGLLGSSAPTQYVWLNTDGTFKIADGKGNVLTTSSSGFALNQSLAVTGAITATGEITRGQGGADSVTLGGHTHTQPPDSHADIEQATAAPTAGT